MRNVRNWIIVALLATLPLAVLGGVLAQQQLRSTTVDLRVAFPRPPGSVSRGRRGVARRHCPTVSSRR